MAEELINERTSMKDQISREPDLPGDGREGAIFWDYTYLLILAGVVIGLDQATKSIVRTNLDLGEMWAPVPTIPFLRIVHWHNTGAAFGLLQDFGSLFTILAFLVALAIVYYFPRVPRGDWPLRLAMGLQLGGALGNLIDRLTIGRVTDFIMVGNFPVFNVADASISIGVAVLVLSVWFRDQTETTMAGGALPLERIEIEGEVETGSDGSGPASLEEQATQSARGAVDPVSGEWRGE